MKSFVYREFDTMSKLWQDYADELHLMLGFRRLDKNEIELSLSTVGSVIRDLNELIGIDGNAALDQHRVGRAKELADYFRVLQDHLKNSDRNESGETAA